MRGVRRWPGRREDGSWWVPEGGGLSGGGAPMTIGDILARSLLPPGEPPCPGRACRACRARGQVEFPARVGGAPARAVRLWLWREVRGGTRQSCRTRALAQPSQPVSVPITWGRRGPSQVLVALMLVHDSDVRNGSAARLGSGAAAPTEMVGGGAAARGGVNEHGGRRRKPGGEIPLVEGVFPTQGGVGGRRDPGWAPDVLSGGVGGGVPGPRKKGNARTFGDAWRMPRVWVRVFSDGGVLCLLIPPITPPRRGD